SIGECGMGQYCKAYYLRDLRKFSGWKERSIKYRDGSDLTDESIVYIHDNFVVRINVDEKKQEEVVFDVVSSEWQQYCSEHLKFEIPEYIRKRQEEDAAPSAARRRNEPQTSTP